MILDLAKFSFVTPSPLQAYSYVADWLSRPMKKVGIARTSGCAFNTVIGCRAFAVGTTRRNVTSLGENQTKVEISVINESLEAYTHWRPIFTN